MYMYLHIYVHTNILRILHVSVDLACVFVRRIPSMSDKLAYRERTTPGIPLHKSRTFNATPTHTLCLVDIYGTSPSQKGRSDLPG